MLSVSIFNRRSKVIKKQKNSNCKAQFAIIEKYVVTLQKFKLLSKTIC